MPRYLVKYELIIYFVGGTSFSNQVNNFKYGFKILQNYNQKEILIIDPLVYSTYIGDSNFDIGYDIEINPLNELFLTGWTYSIKFPTTQGANDTSHNGLNDIFILKIDRNGSIPIYSTFIGGNSYDYGFGVAIDFNGNAYVTGYTDSANFPTTASANDIMYDGTGDVFILKLNQSGSKLLYSTFVNGTDWDYGYAITVDSIGNAFITGGTYSSDFFTTNGANDTNHNGKNDAFILKINQTGSKIIYSTYIGGNGWDSGYDIIIDINGNAFVTGYTYSGNFPTTSGANDTTYNGGYDVFILKLNQDGSTLIYSSYIGGDNDDFGTGIIIDSIGNAYVTGDTNSSNFPVTSNVYDSEPNGEKDVFILKLSFKGNSLMYSTFIGGINNESGLSITSDSLNNLYIYGKTNSLDFPTTLGAIDITYNGGSSDIFILKFNISNSVLLYSTYIGGNNAEHDDPYLYGSIKIDMSENIYITSFTNSTDFPTTLNAFDTSYNGNGDAFILKINPVLNELPSVIDLKISKSIIFRTNSIYLFSNATDFEDLEKNLTPFFEYRYPNEQVWNKTYFSDLQYNNSRWEVSFTPPKNATLGLYDIRVRFNDTFGLCSKLLYLNDSLTVLNNVPWVDNLTLSNHLTLIDNYISLRINGTDIEEHEENLSIELEFRDSNELSWNTTYLTQPRYMNNRWEANFSTPFNTPFGYYDFRVRVNDSDGDYSQWLYANDSLLIYNDHPRVIDIELSNNSVYRTNSVNLFTNITDHETEESMLTFYGQYKPGSETDWVDLLGEYSQSNGRWETEVVTDKDSILGWYDFRVRFEDNETASTGWIYLNDSLEVLNNPPMISDDLDNISVGLSPVIINLSQYGSDIEDSADTLTWLVNGITEYSYLESLTIIKNDTLEIVPLLNVSGYVNIELTLRDKDGGIATKSDITLQVNSQITELTPRVTLLSPPNGSVVSTLTPTLGWKLDYSGDEIITYNIYLDKIPAPEKILKSNFSMTSYTLETELENNTTYYWKVIPSGGVCISDPYCFTVNLSNKPDYKVNLTSENDYIIIQQGSEIEINLTIRNKGILDDMYDIDYKSSTLQEHISIDKILIQLPSDGESVSKLKITIPEDFKLGVHNISVAAKSLSDVTVSDETAITVEVINRDLISKYDVSLAVIPALIEIEQGTTSNVTLSIMNFGNIADIYNISFISDTFLSEYIILEKKLISLNSSDSKSLDVYIIVPESTIIDSYNITFIVQSEYISNKTTLTVHVKAKETPKEPDHKVDNTLIFIITGIVILIIILIVFIILRIRKKRFEESTKSAETQDIKAEVSQESIPATSSPKTIDKLETTISESESPPAVTSTPAIQTTTIQQITQPTTEHPQLPPKQSQVPAQPQLQVHPQARPDVQSTPSVKPLEGSNAEINTITRRSNNI